MDKRLNEWIINIMNIQDIQRRAHRHTQIHNNKMIVARKRLKFLLPENTDQNTMASITMWKKCVRIINVTASHRTAQHTAHAT